MRNYYGEDVSDSEFRAPEKPDRFFGKRSNRRPKRRIGGQTIRE